MGRGIHPLPLPSLMSSARGLVLTRLNSVQKISLPNGLGAEMIDNGK